MKALERAKSALRFEDVFQASASAALDEKFDFKASQMDEAACRPQFKHTVRQSNVLEYKSADSTILLFRVYIDLGIRLLYTRDPDLSDAPVLQIEATYCVDYRITQKSLQNDQAALDAFALHNASYHLWPFWREFVMSQCSRMNAPKIPMPLRFTTQPSAGAPARDRSE